MDSEGDVVMASKPTVVFYFGCPALLKPLQPFILFSTLQEAWAVFFFHLGTTQVNSTILTIRINI